MGSQHIEGSYDRSGSQKDAWRGLEVSRLKALLSHDELGGALIKGATFSARAGCSHMEAEVWHGAMLQFSKRSHKGA